MTQKGVDLGSREGKKQFILAVRELNARFGTELHKDLPDPWPPCSPCSS